MTVTGRRFRRAAGEEDHAATPWQRPVRSSACPRCGGLLPERIRRGDGQQSLVRGPQPHQPTQRDGQPVNVQSVARAAGVHPHTIRRNPDLLKEVQHLRESGWQRPPVTHTDPTAAASHQALKARLLASQAKVADLRRDLAQLRRDAHQALGTAPTRSDPSIVEDLQRQAAELRVQLMNERDTTGSLRAGLAATAEDLTAAHEIARGYLRELNQTKNGLLHARQELVKLRTKASTAGTPPPTSATDRGGSDLKRTKADARVSDLSEQLGPGWRLTQDDGDRAAQRWHLEHDHIRVGVIERHRPRPHRVVSPHPHRTAGRRPGHPRRHGR